MLNSYVLAKRIVRRNAPILKNAHLVGAGAKFTPVYTSENKINWRGSVIKQSNSRSIPSMPKSVTKKPIDKISTSFKTIFSKHQINQAKQVNLKVNEVRLKGLQKIKTNIAKSAPSTIVKMQKTKSIKRKPPTKGR